MFFLALLWGFALAEDFDKLEVLLRFDKDPHLIHELQKQNRTKVDKEKCAAELSRGVIPFTCYKTKTTKHKLLDRLCKERVETLKRSQFILIPQASKVCQRTLVEQKDRLNYILEKESPSFAVDKE